MSRKRKTGKSPAALTDSPVEGAPHLSVKPSYVSCQSRPLLIRWRRGQFIC